MSAIIYIHNAKDLKAEVWTSNGVVGLDLMLSFDGTEGGEPFKLQAFFRGDDALAKAQRYAAAITRANEEKARRADEPLTAMGAL